jgi:hypothetical protein
MACDVLDPLWNTNDSTGVSMKKYIGPLVVVMMTVIGVETVEYVKTANERGRLLGQLQEAAAVVSVYPPDSPEALAAKERGTMIAAGWPCLWWEDRQAVRSKTTGLFENMVALKRRDHAQADPDKQPTSTRRESLN